MAMVTVTLDLDTELVPGRTKASLRALAARGVDPAAPVFNAEHAEAGIARRTARKAAAKEAA